MASSRGKSRSWTRDEMVAFMRCHEIWIDLLIREGIVPSIRRSKGEGRAELERAAAIRALVKASRGHFDKGQEEGARLLRRFSRMKCRPQCGGRVCTRLRAIPGMRLIMNQLRATWTVNRRGD